MHRASKIIAIALGLAFSATLHAGVCPAPPETRRPFLKPSLEQLTAWQSDDIGIIKFADGSGIRLREGSFVVVESEVELDRLDRRGLTRDLIRSQLASLNDLLLDNTASAERQVVSASEETLSAMRCSGEARTGRELPDLNLFYKVRFASRSASDVVAVLRSLNQWELVELAGPEVKVAPSPATDISPPTSAYTGNQSYFQPAPNGIDVNYARALPGGRGEGVRVVVVEKGWEGDHEDFPPLVSTSGYNYTTGVSGNGYDVFRTHGTAVVGQLAAVENGYGMTGIAPAAEMSISSIVLDADGKNNLTDGIVRAHVQSRIGDVILIEQQVYYSYPNDQSFCPPEWDASAFSAIQTAVANGRVVLETAGNGTQNLDDGARFGTRFNRNFEDSGAIYVGAGHPATHAPLPESNFGARVDIQGWGAGLATLGYGDLFYPSSDYRQAYTTNFGGTSGGAALVSGAATLIQSIRGARGLAYLTSQEMRAALLVGATPQGAGVNIGPLPDLRDAIAAIPVPVPAIVATGAGNGSASITWDAVPGVAGYELFRKDAHNGSWTLINTTPAATFFNNGGLAPGATYLYRLRTFDAAGNRSTDSNYELATTIDYTDPQLGAGTLVRARHLIEVRRAVNAICTYAGAAICPATPFSGASLEEAQVKTQPIRASDFTNLASHLVSLRSAIGAAPATFRGPAVAGNPVSRIQMEDLRVGAK